MVYLINYKENYTFNIGNLGILAGNMWGQTWGYIYDLLEPYQNVVALDVSDEMKNQVC